MSNYTQTTLFGPKDSLPTGNPAKTIFGAAYDVEFGNIATAISTKPDNLTTASFLNVQVTSSGIPPNGIYLPAANTLGIAANTTKVATFNTGGMVFGTATGGAQGAGTLNAQGLFVNGVAVVTTSTVSGSANPSATIGLSAVDGTATTFMTSDSAPPLSQAISPTWSGTHTFSNAITVNGSGSALKGAVSITAPSIAATALTVTGSASGGATIIATVGTASASGVSIQGANGIQAALQLFQTAQANWVIYNPASSSDLRINNTTTGDILKITLAGAVSISNTTAGTSLVVNTTLQSALLLSGNGGSSFFELTNTNASGRSYALNPQRTGVGNDGFEIYDVTAGAARLQVNASGNFLINAPSSGVSLTLANGIAGQAVLSAGPGASSSWATFPLLFTIGHSAGDYPRAGYNFTPTTTTAVHNYTTTDFASAIFYQSGGFSFQTAPSGTAGNPITFTTAMQILQAGNVTISTPSSGTALTVNSVAASTGVTATDGTVSATLAGFGGTQLNVGTTTNHAMTLGTNNTIRITIANTGGVTMNNASGTPLLVQANGTNVFEILGTSAPTVEGYGPTAAGLVDMTPDTGTFTATLTGCTTSPTVTATWTRIGKLVILNIPAVTAVSNATTCTFTGLPAAIQPATLTQLVAAVTEDNGTWADGGLQIQSGSGTMNLYKGGATAVSSFTNVGTKGWPLSSTIAYLLN